jgi:ribonuclease HII
MPLMGRAKGMSSTGSSRQLSLFPEGSSNPDPWVLDEGVRGRGYPMVAGLDEAGRGPLAGPVVAAAVILPSQAVIPGLTDSKALTPGQRDELFHLIQETAIAVAVGAVGPEDIDRINILQATRRAMEEAVAQLAPQPHALLIDGRMSIRSSIAQFSIVKGDVRSHTVAAASVVAKVTRDRIMTAYHESFPQYGFHRHKGYGTQEHLEAIRLHGCSPIHRKSFRGVRGKLGANGDELR